FEHPFGLAIRICDISRFLFSGCWIVTGGFHLGVMKLTGEAVRDYTDAYGGNRMMAFGVASWDCVTKNEILEAALHEVRQTDKSLALVK
ncbi:Transient receptor potential cation channel trpm, partial [Fasciolopsis buskii]